MENRNRTDRERDILDRAARVLPQGSLGNLNYDLIINKGMGSHIWDESGNEYIDYLLGSGPMLVGHANPPVIEAVLNQLSEGTTFFATNEKSVQLAEEIVEAVPCADKVRFLSTGSEATLYAMRLARSFRGKDKILKFEGGFHGMNDYALMSMSPSTLMDFPQAEPDTAGIPKSVRSEMLIAPFNDLETTTAIIDRYSDELG
ncbi:MAG TPA: aspartate aminotransferase family protein, partial [Dehalococcoidia bacterium]|nr:aspartate aminotransferase family protein [Dehalococcoidia bacterium]